MTIVVPVLRETKTYLSAQAIKISEINEGIFAKIAQLTDPDGNLVTLAEPPKA